MRRDLDGKVGLVLSGKHAIGDVIQDLRQLGRVVLTDGENDGLADLAADGIAQGILHESFAENLVGRVGKEAFLELTLLEGLPLVLSDLACLCGVCRQIGEGNDKSLLREQPGRHVRAGVHHGGID